MLKMARYAAIPHANARTHKIPIAVIEQLTGTREQDALDGKRCLFELLVVSHGDLPTALPPVILVPTSGGEVRFGKKLLPGGRLLYTHGGGGEFSYSWVLSPTRQHSVLSAAVAP